jgi:Ca-activated chloride channel homolog
MDIDNASYRLAKTMLERGQLPDPAGIRTEEFVNGLDYQYLPSKDLIGLSAEVVPSPFRPGYHVLHLGVQIKQITDSERLPSNLVLVVDISGSMKSDNKIDTLKSAMRSLVAQLGAQDTVGIVAYNNSASTVLYPTSAKNKAMIYKQIDSLATGGGTNAAQGIIKGYQLADKIFKRGYNNRVILTSDGMANVGDVKPEEILNKVNQYKKKGVFLTTVGVGAGMYNDHLLEQLANKGNGNYVYLSDKEDIEDTFVDGINSQLQTMVKDAKIQLKFNPDVVSRFRQIGYENRSLNHQDFTDGSKDGGELGAGHRVTALYEIKLNPSNTTDPIGDFAVSYKKPMGNKVFLLEKKLPAGIVRPTIERAASDTKLSIVAAGLAEKLRQTYWSSFYQYSVMMNLMQQLPPNYSNTRMVTGLRQMVINAMRLDNRVNPYSNDAQPVTLSFDHVPLIE